ncbi:NAD+ synthase (glutamine-hydrolysing) [Parapedobacter composti]|uniref:Glutamine-dependent NAD(+) synthetase n=1 Tax=Parapedobacter composti TaxID=623281 RepID=A0A1I1E1S0_9SPHI|nr:NAD+ synthase [Parapedobacter composti]SFB81209.1 NAD+ synthase (glutamine-hydrolysing) [Parapedobacter composti]
MIIALAQLNYHIGNFEYNTSAITGAIQQAKDRGADMVVFAELAIGGYPAKDLLRSDAFLNQCETSIAEIAAHCHGIACIIGAPVRNTTGQGKPLFNAALFIAEGTVQRIVHKGLLPDYDVFDEYRYFQPADTFGCVRYRGHTVALTICEDLWNIASPKLYRRNPMDALREENPDVIINIAASPFSYNHLRERMEVLVTHARQTQTPLLYLNHVGAHTDIIFDGRSIVLDASGGCVDMMASFAEDLKYYELGGGTVTPLHETYTVQPPLDTPLIHQALLLGIRDYFSKSGFKKAVVGLSGGIDSAVVAALACEALGAENVMAVLMPSAYSSDHSITDALELVRNTGCRHEIVPIQSIADAFNISLAPAFQGLPPDVTEENIQARVRGTLLMAFANKRGYILLNTSNKSEAAVGYGTLYGDMAGALGVIGDIYKTQVYKLAGYLNRDKPVIPQHTIIKPPSAELRPGQQDSDSLPEYELLDAVLFQYIENEKSAAQIVSLGFDESLVKRVLDMVNKAEFKRFQAPPILRVSSKAFGTGRSMPLVARYPY